MVDVTKEIDEMAEKIEKSVQGRQFSLDLVKSTIKTLGPEGLKKAAATLSDKQKDLLKEVLEDMKKSHVEPIKNKEESLEPLSNTTAEGDYHWNETKPTQTERDEELNEEAKKRRQMEHRNQGGVPVEGWEGQVIKADIEKSRDQGIGAVVDYVKDSQKPAKTFTPPVSKAEEDKEDEKKEEMEKDGTGSGRKPETAQTQSKFREGQEQAPAEGKKEEPKTLEEKKKAAKANLKKMMSRMQERKMEKSECVAKLAKSFDLPEEKLSVVWDVLAKGDVLPEKENPEASQVSVPSQMKSDEGAKVNDPEDPSVPKYQDKTSKKVAKEDPAGGKPHTLADKGEQPPAPMKKSYYYEEEPVYFAKSEENPFSVRTIKPNAHYKVDEMIEAQVTSQKERLAKSTFDYADEEETFQKGMEPSEQDVVAANAKKKADAKKEDAAEVRQIKVDEKLSRIEDRSGPKMPFVKKMKKAAANELIEKSLDMDQTTFELAKANLTSEISGGFLVKSFDDSDMDALFTEQDMYRSEKK